MRVPVRMSQIGFGQDTATIVAWLKSVGDAVESGDAIVEVEVEKVDMEVEVFDSGILAEILFEAGERIAVGQVIAYLDGDVIDLANRFDQLSGETAR
jgi:pyruvate/2-oxoglutarate dehydrogenase complex dihydrolipoamide acyltransferase (E2) component